MDTPGHKLLDAATTGKEGLYLQDPKNLMPDPGVPCLLKQGVGQQSLLSRSTSATRVCEATPCAVRPLPQFSKKAPASRDRSNVHAHCGLPDIVATQ